MRAVARVLCLLTLCLSGIWAVEIPTRRDVSPGKFKAFAPRRMAQQPNNKLFRRRKQTTLPTTTTVKPWQTSEDELIKGATTAPSSFTMIATMNAKKDFSLLLYTLGDHHPGAKVYVFCDTGIMEMVEGLVLQPNLQMNMIPMLDKYGDATRETMEQENTWGDFQMEKAKAIHYALLHESDTLFIDSDISVLAPIEIPVQQILPDGQLKYQIGLSPHRIAPKRTKAYGHFNGGLLWVADRTVPDAWAKFTKTSRYYDQASLEDLADSYRYFLFGEEVNYASWRWDHPAYHRNAAPELNADGRTYIKGKPLVCLHHHFFSFKELKFQRMIRYMLLRSPAYARFLALLDYIEYDFDPAFLPSAAFLPSQKNMLVMGLAGDMICVSVRSLVLSLSALFLLYRFCRRPVRNIFQCPTRKTKA